MSKSRHNRVKKTKSGHKIVSSHKDWVKRTAYAKEQIRLAEVRAEGQRIASRFDIFGNIKNFLTNKSNKEKADGRKKIKSSSNK